MLDQEDYSITAFQTYRNHAPSCPWIGIRPLKKKRRLNHIGSSIRFIKNFLCGFCYTIRFLSYFIRRRCSFASPPRRLTLSVWTTNWEASCGKASHAKCGEQRQQANIDNDSYNTPRPGEVSGTSHRSFGPPEKEPFLLP